MLDDIRKSINSTLYERVSSPLYGTIIISWLIWNWEIVYLTLFINETRIGGTKIDYIIENYSNIHNLLTFPAISTLLLLTVMPFASNGAYYLSLVFKKWRTEKRNEVDNKQLLSIEKSIALREEIRNQEEKFDKLLEGKNEEIKILTQEVENYRSASTTSTEASEDKPKRPTSRKKSTGEAEFEQLKKSGKINSFISQGDRILKDGLVKKGSLGNVSEALAFGLIEMASGNIEYVKLTNKGNEFFKWHILNEK